MALNKTAIIYIPGLGDKNPRFQTLAVKMWRIYGYKSQLIQMNWDDKTSWSKKLPLIIKQIDYLFEQGYKVSLVGASAGATAVVNAYAERSDKIDALITIAGKINRPETLGQKYIDTNPSFIESINQAQKSLNTLQTEDLKKFLCIYSLKDGLVTKEDSIINGAKSYESKVPYHPLAIAYYLTIGFYKINQHIRLLTKGV